MQPLPHHYAVAVTAAPEGKLSTTGHDVPELLTSPPVQFGGEGGDWSPEDLLLAATANCLALSFRAIARASRLDWVSLQCATEGTLDKVERTIKFTSMTSRVKLVLPAGADIEKGKKLLQKAEDSCLVSNTLNCPVHLEMDVQTEG